MKKIPMTRKCLQCKQPTNDFSKYRGQRVHVCRTCVISNQCKSKRQYYENNKERIKKRSSVFQHDRQREWNRYLQNKYGDPSCQLCLKKLRWPYEADKPNVVCLDYRMNGVEVIKCSPSKWIHARHCTPENVLIFESCNFGLLCNRCNRLLPTYGRSEWARRMIEYVKATQVVTNIDPG